MQLFLPPTELHGVVECAILVQREAGALSRFPAMPRAMLTLAPAHGGAAAVSFHAMSTRSTAHEHAQPLLALGLVLPPDTAARLLGMSTGALVDTTLPWAELAGLPEVARLDDALQQARSDLARLAGPSGCSSHAPRHCSSCATRSGARGPAPPTIWGWASANWSVAAARCSV
jgi:hypothetical protein